MVERERSIFNNTLLPAAIDALVRTRGVTQSAQYIENSQHPATLATTNTAALPEQSVVVNPTTDFSRMSLSSFVKSKGADALYDFIICAVYFNEK